MFHGALAVLRHLSDYMLISFRDGENKRGDVRALFLFEIILCFSCSSLKFRAEQTAPPRSTTQNTYWAMCSSSLLQCNLNVHLLDTHYFPTWSNGYESIGLENKDSQSLKSRRWSSSEVWKPAIESESRRERPHISDPTAERRTRWHAARRWQDLTSGRSADDKQRRS